MPNTLEAIAEWLYRRYAFEGLCSCPLCISLKAWERQSKRVKEIWLGDAQCILNEIERAKDA